MRNQWARRWTVVCALIIPALAASAQPPQDPRAHAALFRTLFARDSGLFDAFNRCELTKLESYFTDDLEFYHDQTGLSRGRAATIEAIRTNICGKVRRTIVPASLEVNPLANYGAVQSGVHLFCDTRLKSECDSTDGPARFTHIWQQANGVWRISRVISYDHLSRAPSGNQPPPAMRAELDARIPDLLADAEVPSIAIAYIRNGAVAWTRVYGEQAKGVPATNKTLYNVASLTKPVFAELVLRLAGEGKLSLDEAMARYWVDPDVAKDPRTRLLTPRIALSHRTGFENWRRESQSILQFRFDPGTQFRYSGEGYEYTSRFLQRKLSMNIEELGRKYLFQPLAMHSTAFVRQDWFDGRVAMPKGSDGTYGEPDFSEGGNAADNLYTTVDDYATFVSAVATHRGLPDSFARQRDSLHIRDTSKGNACNPDRVPVCPTRIGHGLGWSIQEYPNGNVMWHTGADWGERAMVFLFPKHGDGAVLLTNGANGFKVIIEVGSMLFPDSPFARFLRAGKD